NTDKSRRRCRMPVLVFIRVSSVFNPWLKTLHSWLSARKIGGLHLRLLFDLRHRVQWHILVRLDDRECLEDVVRHGGSDEAHRPARHEGGGSRLAVVGGGNERGDAVFLRDAANGGSTDGDPRTHLAYRGRRHLHHDDRVGADLRERRRAVVAEDAELAL